MWCINDALMSWKRLAWARIQEVPVVWAMHTQWPMWLAQARRQHRQYLLHLIDQASKQATMAAQGLVKAQQDILWKSQQMGSHGGGSQPKGKGEGKKGKTADNDHESRKSRKGREWQEKTDERKKWQQRKNDWTKP